MSETARDSVRGEPASSSWEELLDPAALKARLEEARLRREQVLAQRAAAGEGANSAASLDRADRLRSLDRALAGKPEPARAPAGEAPGPVLAPDARPGSRPVPGVSARPEARVVEPPVPLRGTGAVCPETVVRVERSPGGQPVTRPAAIPEGSTMAERLASVIVRPAPEVQAPPVVAVAPRRRLPWPALLLGLLVGGGGAVLAIWWPLPDPQPRLDTRPTVESSAPAVAEPPAVVTVQPSVVRPAAVAQPLEVPETASAIPSDPAIALGPLDARPAVPPDAGVTTVTLTREAVPGALESPADAALGAAREIAAGAPVEVAPPAPRFVSAGPEAVAAIAEGRQTALSFADGPLLAGLVDYPVAEGEDVAEDEAPAAPAPVKARTVRAPKPPAVAAAPSAAPGAAERSAPAEDSIVRSTLEHAVESMLRNHLLGK